MPRSSFSRFQETARASAEIRRERANAVRRARAELAETREATRAAITKSRELMAEIDAVMLGGSQPQYRGASLRKGRVMAEHKFRAGQRVRLAPNPASRHAGGRGYVITKQLPERDGEFEYRIKSTSEPRVRVVNESALARE